jgi:transposase
MQMAIDTHANSHEQIHADVFALLKSKERVIAELTSQIDSLKLQLDWFKRQMFGAKSERFVLDNPAQLSLGAALPLPDKPIEPTRVVPAHTHRRA